MRAIAAHRFAFLAAALLAAGCQQMPQLPFIKGQQQPAAAAPATAAPQITEQSLRERAQEQLALGVKQYDAGEFDSAVRNLSASLEHGMLSKVEQARARKYIAFSHCVAGRELHCRDEFRKAFEIYPDFALTQAEDGHPIWGPVYRAVRTQLITEREAAQRKPITLLPQSKGETFLADGVVKYDSGDYAAAQKLLENALKEGLGQKSDQVRAMKYLAFTLCLESKWERCRTTFVKIYDIDPKFDLMPAEAGHPSWTKTFAQAKAMARKEAQEKSAKEKAAAPPTAGVPKK